MKSISTDTSRPLVLTEEDYEDIIASMPGGMNGFLKSWGLLQFAAAVEEALINKAAQDATTAARIEQLQLAIKRRALEQQLDKIRDMRVSEAFCDIVEFVYGPEDV